MPVGIEIINDADSVLLSTNLRNPVLRAQGNMTTVANTITPDGASMAQVSYLRASGDDAPLIAIAPSDLTALISLTDYTNITWEWNFLSDLPIGSTIPYYIFDKPPAPSGSFGLEIYDAAGDLCFSIQDKPLRSRDLIDGTFTFAGGANFTYETGRDYAAVLTRWTTTGVYQSLPNHTTEYLCAVKQIADGINQGRLRFQQPTGDTTAGLLPERRILVVDVTDY